MDSLDVGGNDRGLRASFLRTFFAIALEQNFGETKRSGSYDVASHDPLQVVRSGGKCGVRVFAHVQQRVPSTYRYRANKRVLVKWHNEVPNACVLPWRREQEGQYSSPTKRIRSKPTRGGGGRRRGRRI